MPREYRVRTVQAWDEVEALRETWLALEHHPNADFDFYKTIVGQRADRGARPFALIVEEGSRVAALAAGRLEQERLTARVGYFKLRLPRVTMLTVIYGGLMGERTDEVNAAIADGILGALKSGVATVARVAPLRMDDALLGLLRTTPGMLCRDHFVRPEKHFAMVLGDSPETVFQHRSGLSRKKLRRERRLFERAYEGRLDYRFCETEDGVDELCDWAERVAKGTYHRGLEVGFRDTPETRARLKLEARRGRLQAAVGLVDNDPFAFLIGTMHGQTLHLDYTGYDPAYAHYSVGKILLATLLEHAVATRGAARADFGLGDAPYKRWFCDDAWDEAAVYVWSPTLRGALLNGILTTSKLADAAAERLVERAGILQRVKKAWRSARTPAQADKSDEENAADGAPDAHTQV